MSRKAADIVVKDKGSKWDRSKAYGPEFVTEIMRHPGNGTHHTRDLDVAKGKSRKPKLDGLLRCGVLRSVVQVTLNIL